MSKTCIIALIAFASVGAQAQMAFAQSSSAAVRRGEVVLPRSYFPDATGNHPSSFVPQQVECLIEKATKRQVCHSRAEWREIAERIDRQTARDR